MMPAFTKKRSAVMNTPSIFNTMKHYVGKVRTIRNEIRTVRLLNSLPPEIRADIGWPDMHRGDDNRLNLS
ncbi:MAG: hypothetical protein BGO03_02465 [Mesorhizobium sp. 61-13]|jgi:hypothetical protein|nr:MAG: hypothetical protein BGO03_02465 [Mesorhizobium sp. 61-13]